MGLVKCHQTFHIKNRLKSPFDQEVSFRGSNLELINVPTDKQRGAMNELIEMKRAQSL